MERRSKPLELAILEYIKYVADIGSSIFTRADLIAHTGKRKGYSAILGAPTGPDGVLPETLEGLGIVKRISPGNSKPYVYRFVSKAALKRRMKELRV